MNIIPNPDENEYESLNNKVAELMKVFDSNKDGSITMKEFGKATEKVQDPLGDEEYLDVTMADGTIKKIHKSELFNNVKDSSKGFEMKNDKIYKEEQKNGNITELTEKDPALGNMIRIGKWAAGQLNLLNFTSGLLLNLESLPNGGSVVSKERLQKEPELLGVKFNGPFEVWLKLTMGSSKAADPNITFFEIHLEYSREKYRSPFLALLEVWVLETSPISGPNEGSRDVRVLPLEVPPPALSLRFSAFLQSEFQKYTSSPYAGIASTVLIGLIVLSVIL
eukprot:gene16334-18638_t